MVRTNILYVLIAVVTIVTYLRVAFYNIGL